MTRPNPLHRLIRLALPLLLAAAPAWGQSIVSTGESFAEARLIAGRPAPEGGRMAGLVVELAPGWKTYWRSPGEAGVPPVFDWSGSENLAAVDVLWPRPMAFESFGMETLGYAERVVFPLRLTPADPARPIGLSLDLSLGVCRELCVLEEATLAAEIAPGAQPEGAALIAAAEAAVPPPGAQAGLSAAECRIAPAGARRDFRATLAFDRPVTGARVIVEGPPTAWVEAIETAPAGDTLEVSAALVMTDAAAWIGRSDIRMTVLAADFAADIKGCAAPAG